MKNVYCTLFNVNYLDKGIVLYESLERVCQDFVLYVLAMDDKCYEVLTDLSKKSLRPIRLSEFENEELIKAKNNRSFGEYCWTCSSSLIKYVLEEYNEPICTYVDADMCFYKDPSVLIDEMLSHKAEVLVVGHRFNSFEREERERISGKYCVEFNTFLNSERAKTLLDIWVGLCLESCSSTVGEGSLGDQMYLTNWTRDYNYVWETRNLGAGVAPWNIKQYKLLSEKDGHFQVRCDKNECELIFYHFEHITYLSKELANINLYESWGIDNKFVKKIYGDYLYRIEKVKTLLEDNYGLDILLKRHPAMKGMQMTMAARIKVALMKMKSASYIRHFILSGLPKYLYRNRNLIKIQTIVG